MVLAGVVVCGRTGRRRAGGGQRVADSPLCNGRHARHVVLLIAAGDVRPVQLTVATRQAVDNSGALVAKNVRLRETIQLTPPAPTGVARWQSRTTLAPGTYFVQVMAVESGGGITNCPQVPAQLPRPLVERPADHRSDVELTLRRHSPAG